MARTPTLLGPDGQPIRRQDLTREVATPQVAGVRQVVPAQVSAGLKPQRLAQMLREAEEGNEERFLTLAEEVEEKYLHYQGVIGTRRRAVAQLQITVEPGDDDTRGAEIADALREWIERGELEDELVDVLDALGKGFSVTEIIWDTSARMWWPERLEWRQPQWFTFDRADGRTLLLRGEAGAIQGEPLPPWKFIVHRARAKSGLPIRGGLARGVAWAWLFQAFSLRDWVIFSEAYGQPLRLGRLHAGATEKEADTLLRAVSSISSDFAAVIGAGMEIEFPKVDQRASADLYEKLCEFLDRQVSKAVLGQTATTDAIAGGHAVGRTHELVRRDVMRADAGQLAATLNRDLVRPFVDLNWGPQKRYPRVVIGLEEEVDSGAMTAALKGLVPLGLRVSATDVRDKLGFAAPEEGDEVLGGGPVTPPPGQPPAAGPAEPEEDPAEPDPEAEPPEPQETAAQSARTGRLGRYTIGRDGVSAQAESPPPDDSIDRLVSEMLAEDGWEAVIGPQVGVVEQLLAESADLLEARDKLAALLEGAPSPAVVDALARALFAGRLAGDTGLPISDQE